MVSDTGAGIPKEKQATLFKRFAQAGNASMNHQGTGLGLYISKGIIEAHGGTISLTSEEGHGTTFSFTIPIVTMSQDQLQAPQPTLQPPPAPQVTVSTLPAAQNKIPN